jgi:hypothetical protein
MVPQAVLLSTLARISTIVLQYQVTGPLATLGSGVCLRAGTVSWVSVSRVCGRLSTSRPIGKIGGAGGEKEPKLSSVAICRSRYHGS